MTSPWGNPPQIPKPPHIWPAAAPEATTVTLTVTGDPLCGHLPGEAHDGACDYWRGVLTGEYPHPDTYMVTGGTTAIVLPRHLPGLHPLTDRALGGAA